MNTRQHLCLLGFSSALAVTGNAEAMLLGVVQSFPDVTLNQNYLIYDNNAIDSNTGLLKLVSYASTLNEGPGAGNSTLTQSYSGAGDPYPNLMLTIAVDRNTGNWVSSSNPVANKVTIGFGNTVIPNAQANTPGFSWQGDITGFGWQQDIPSTVSNESGKFFDATWIFTNDDYEDMPATMAQFTDGVLTSAMAAYQGGIKISNSAGFGSVTGPAAFQRDWVFGANANSLGIQTLLGTFLSGMSGTACSPTVQTGCTNFVHSSITSDVFAPIPPALWLWSGALVSLAPSVRRLKSTTLLRRT